MTPILSVVAPRSGSTGKVHAADAFECVQQLVNGGFAQLGIGGMRQLALRDDFVTQHALGRRGQLVFGGLAVDEVARAARVFGGGVGAGAVALFAHDEQQAEIAHAGGQQAFGGDDHGGDDALGVGRAAAPDAVGVLARGKEGRHGVHVRRERDHRLAPLGEDVEAIALDRAALDASRRCARPGARDGRSRYSPTGASWLVTDSMSTSARVSSNTFMRLPDPIGVNRMEAEKEKLRGGPFSGRAASRARTRSSFCTSR